MASSSTAWTEEEQQLLEEGLMKFAMICDIKEKWKAIAGHVGTRDVRACADRFKVCRQRALEQQRALKEQEEQEEEEEEESEWRQGDWNEWKKDDWWNGWWSGWQDRSWKEEAPLEEADRRKWEIQQEIEANRRKLEQKEEQKRQHETKREDKLRAEREQKEKERQEQQKAREQKIIEAQEREKQQRLEEEKRQRELQRKMEEEDAKAGFYGTRHLNLSGKQGKGKGRAWGKGPSKGELQKQRREEEMERRAREVLANIGAKKTESPEVENVEASIDDSEPQRATSATPDVPSKAKGAKGKGGDTSDAGDRENVDLKGGKGKEGKGGKGGKGKSKERRRPGRPGWWTKIDGDCPISLVPIAEMPVPPFGLKAEGSSVPHYFDGQFLASFLLSSFDFINPVNRTPLSREDCSALDAHLRDFYPSQSASVTDAFDLFQRNGGTGSDAVRREATAVFQHLFRFTHAQNMDSRGRAINFNDGGLTVIDDDDIRVTAAQHAVASTAQALAESDEVPVDTGHVPSPSALRGPSGAWASRASRPQPIEEFPALPGAKAKAGSKAKAKAKAGSKAASKAKATPARGLVVPKTWAKPN